MFTSIKNIDVPICQRKLSKILVFILISLILVNSSSEFLPPVAADNWTVATYWPSRVLDPGQSVSIKVIVKQGIVDAFLEPAEHFTVNEVSIYVDYGGDLFDSVSKNYNRRIELMSDFVLPFSFDANAEPGPYQFRTYVEGTIVTGSPIPRYAQEKIVFEDSGTIWIRGQEERNVTETLGGVSVTIKAVFPSMAEEGETIVGRATIIPDSTIQMMGGVFTLKSSTLTIRPMGISKAIAPVGTTLSGARTFDVPVKVPNGTQPGTHIWRASATATGKALGMEVTRTVTVTGSLIIKERKRPGGGGIDEELDCIIATAAFGSRMHANVEAMRHLRDNSVKITFTGGNFMKVFNGWYYSWSPAIAKAVHDNESLRSITRVILYPVVGSVIAAQNTVPIFSFSGELVATVSILIAAFICGIFYITPLLLLIRSFGKRMSRIKSTYTFRHQNILLLFFGLLSSLLTIIGLIANSSVINAIGVTTLALIVTISAATITIRALTKIELLMKTTLTK